MFKFNKLLVGEMSTDKNPLAKCMLTKYLLEKNPDTGYHSTPDCDVFETIDN